MNVQSLDVESIPSPCFVVDEVAVEQNLQVADRIQKETGAKVLLALKGFAMWSLFPLIQRTLAGCCASGLNEALLAREKFVGEIHVHGPAFPDDDLERLLDIADHISFNSMTQWKRARGRLIGSDTRAGIRINPECSEVETPIYDPCAPGSRLGVTIEEFKKHTDELVGISGLHFHTLCELNAESLERTLEVVEKRFGWYLADSRVTWVNFGGGHHISRGDYSIELLVRLINDFRAKYDVEVILEPGEAIALNSGVLVATVLDIVRNGDLEIAIVDTSASAHMPDVLEMPYRPELVGNSEGSGHNYRVGGITCLAGDVIGDYSFAEPLSVGDRLIFSDMAHYTMVKTTTFNGVNLPSIAIYNSLSGESRVVRRFGYEDYRSRLS